MNNVHWTMLSLCSTVLSSTRSGRLNDHFPLIISTSNCNSKQLFGFLISPKLFQSIFNVSFWTDLPYQFDQNSKRWASQMSNCIGIETCPFECIKWRIWISIGDLPKNHSAPLPNKSSNTGWAPSTDSLINPIIWWWMTYHRSEYLQSIFKFTWCTCKGIAGKACRRTPQGGVWPSGIKMKENRKYQTFSFKIWGVFFCE